jgi:hypothetical protein
MTSLTEQSYLSVEDRRALGEQAAKQVQWRHRPSGDRGRTGLTRWSC